MISLIDRLFDDSPDQPRDPPPNSGAEFEALRIGLRRDLEALLNTRRPYCAWAARVQGTVASFGLADITTEDFSSAPTRTRISAEMAAAIQRFEPRLARVEIEFDQSSTVVSGVRFRIRATLRDDVFESQLVEYGARLRPIDRSILVDAAM